MTLKPEHIVEALNKTPELKRRLILRIMEELLDSVPFDGMEVWHPSVLKEEPHHDWLQVARNHHLIPSGGSDLHGNKLQLTAAIVQVCDLVAVS